MTEQTAHVVEQTVEVVESAAHVVEQTAPVAKQAVHVVSEEWDWATVREAGGLAATALLRFVQWWLCARGFHAWETWEYNDGTVIDECASCQVVRPGVAAA